MALLEDFEAALRSRLGLKIRRREEDPDAIILFADLSPLHLNFHPSTPFLLLGPTRIAGREESLPGILQEVRVRHRLTERTCFALVDADSAEPLDRHRNPLALLVLIDRKSGREALAAPAMADALVAIACRQLPRTLLSPYETSRPVTGGQFFGRETEIRLVASKPKTSYVLLGMRRVGKTSLMKEVLRRLEDESRDEDRPVTGERPHVTPRVFVDCSTHSGEDLLRTIVERIDLRKLRRFQPARYADMLRELSSRGKRRIHIFLDEVDKVLELDAAENWTLFKRLRASAIEGSARYVLTGHQRVIEQLILRHSPIFNFVEPIEIGSFPREVARQLLREPMARLKVRMDEPIADRIIRESGGHPNILQFYCQSFIKKLDLTGRDEVLAEDVEALQDDASFDAFVMSTFEINTTPLEKLIVFLMLERDSFTLTNLNGALIKKRFQVRDRSLQTALTNLRHAGFLEQKGQAYLFKIPIFSRLLSQRYDLDYLESHVWMEQQDALVQR